MSSQKRDLHDVAARFARKARSDEIALDKLADDPDVPDDLIGFHAQQALEKLLKAALAHAGVAPPRIHDLGKLLALLTDADMSPPASAREVRALVPWAVEFRYDDVLERTTRPHCGPQVGQAGAQVARRTARRPHDLSPLLKWQPCQNRPISPTNCMYSVDRQRVLTGGESSVSIPRLGVSRDSTSRP